MMTGILAAQLAAPLLQSRSNDKALAKTPLRPFCSKSDQKSLITYLHKTFEYIHILLQDKHTWGKIQHNLSRNLRLAYAN